MKGLESATTDFPITEDIAGAGRAMMLLHVRSSNSKTVVALIPVKAKSL